MSEQNKKSLHIRLSTQTGITKSLKSIKKINSESPPKFPPVQQICKTIQGEDGTVFSLSSLINKGNKSSCRSYRQLQRTTMELNERRDLKMLGQWMDSMSQQLQIQEYASIQEFYDKMEIVYTGAVEQLNQQLAVKCSDYSDLLTRIWQAFTGTVKQIIEKQCITNRKLEKESLTETIKLHELYQKTLNDRLRRLAEAETSAKRNQEWAERMTKENRHLRKKASTLEQELHIVKTDMEMVRLHLQDAIKENEALKLFQNQQLKRKRRHRRGELSIEELENEFEEELFKAKKEIFDDFKKKFDQQTRQHEEAYQQRIRELERNDDKAERDQVMLEDYVEVLFRDQCVGNTVVQKTVVTETTDLRKFENAFTQTFQPKRKTFDCGTQTPYVVQFTQAAEANFAIIKRECVPRNKDEQTYLEMARYPLSVFIDDFREVRINQSDIDTKAFIGIFQELVDLLHFRSTQLFNILKFKEEFFMEDFDKLNEYFKQSYSFFHQLAYDYQDIIKRFKEELIVRKIQIFETQINCKLIDKQRQQIDRKFNLLTSKYTHLLKQDKFIMKNFTQMSKYIPQYHLDQIRRKGAKRKIVFEFERTRTPIPSYTKLSSFDKPPSSQANIGSGSQGNLNSASSQTMLATQGTLEKLIPQTLSSQNTLTLPVAQIPPQQRKSLGFLQEIPEPQIASKSSFQEFSDSRENIETVSPVKPQINLFFPECTQEETESDTESEDLDLDKELDPIKNTLTIEKRLFMCNCNVRYAQVSTNVLVQEVQSFRRDKKEGLQKLVTLTKQLTMFVQWCIRQNKFNIPLHVQLYDSIATENFSQPASVWQQKLARVVKSLLYYKKKSNFAKLFIDMMLGELSFNVYLQVLNGIQQKDFTDSGLTVLHSQFIESLNQHYKCHIQKNPSLIDYNQEIQLHICAIMNVKLDEIKVKYEDVLRVFRNDENRLTQNQFATLISEIEKHKTEKWINQLFESESDIEQGGTRYMTFDRFVMVCEEFGLLKSLPEYLKQNNTQYFNDLELWRKREVDLKLMLIRSFNYDGAEKEFFQRMYKLQPNQRIIMGRYLERRAKDILLETYTCECLAPFMLFFEQKMNKQSL